MATCSDGDSFYLDAYYTYDGLATYDGCYSDSGFTFNDLTLYFRGGDMVDGETLVYATDYFGYTESWVLAYHNDTEDLFYLRCKDADEIDATLIHPTEVTQWDCTDDDFEYTRLDAVTTACNCPTPSPTWAPTPAPTAPEPTSPPLTPTPASLTPTPASFTPTAAPSTPTPEPVAPVSPSTPPPTDPPSCGATESFRITSGGLPEVEGCFQATEESFSNPGSTFEVWSVSGNTEYDQVVVSGLAGDGTGENDWPYILMYFVEVEDDRISYCESNEDAITVHPVDATWQCDFSGTGSFVPVTDTDISFDCGCTAAPTPSPVVPEPPSPPPSLPPSSSSSVPLGAVIGGSVGGAVFLAIVGVFVTRRRRENRGDENFGSPPPGARNVPAISGGGGVAAAVAGGRGGPVPPPPPPAYSGPPPTADLVPASGDLPPPPPYSGPPAYSG